MKRITAAVSIFPGMVVVPLPDWCLGWENRFGYNFYSIRMDWCVVTLCGDSCGCSVTWGEGVGVIGWRSRPCPFLVWYLCCDMFFTTNATISQILRYETGSSNPETNLVKPNQGNGNNWYCCSWDINSGSVLHSVHSSQLSMKSEPTHTYSVLVF